MSTTQKPTNPLFTRQALVALLLPLIAEQALSVTIGLADTLSAGRPFSPANLQADMLAKYPDKTAYEPPIPYDYAVYYGKDLAPSKEFS